jgi:hypothetical protein
MEDFRTKWAEFYDAYYDTMEYGDIVNNFCNINATSYEEYMTMWEILMDGEEEV